MKVHQLASGLLLVLGSALAAEAQVSASAETNAASQSQPPANAEQLWLRPLLNVNAGDINQIQLDEHVLQHASNGQLRVLDAEMQPLASELRQLPPPLAAHALTIIALDEAAYADIDNAVAEEAISVAVQEQALIVQLRQQRQPSRQRWLLRSQLLSGHIEQLDLDWQGLGQQLHSLQISGSSDLQQWQPLLTTHLEPGQQQQQIKLNSQRLRYLLLTIDSGPQTQLRNATLQLRPITTLPWLWASTQASRNGLSWQIQTPAIAATQLRYSSAKPFAANIRLTSAEAGQHEAWQQRWNIQQSNDKSAASHRLYLPQGVKSLLLESSAALPEGEWQWGWQLEPYLFLATGNGPYFLAYGALLAAEQTPLGALLNGLDNQLHQISLGEPQLRWITPAAAPHPWRQWLLMASLCGAGLLIIALAVSQWRRLKLPAASAPD